MIQGNDLKQGNKFNSPFGNVETVLEIIDNTGRGKINQYGYEVLIVPCENGNQYKPIEIEGIPITEEWLLKFKCEQSSSCNFYWSLKTVSFFFDKDRSRIMLDIGGQYRYFHHVHEFQNVMHLAGIKI